MSYTCAICGKGTQYGQNIRHKHSGSWALRAPKTKKRWLPNLQNVRVPDPDSDGTRTIRVCTKCLKAGKVTRAAK